MINKLFTTTISITICLLFSLNSNAQDEKNNLDSTKKNIIKFSPLNLIDPINTNISLSYERLLKNQFSIQITGGYILPERLININSSYYNNSKGGIIRLEFKKYLIKKYSPLKGLFVASEIGYLFNNYNSKLTFEENDYNDRTNDPMYIDEIKVIKDNFLVNFKFGYQIVLKNNFVIEPHIGIGLKHRNVDHLNRTNLNDRITRGDLFSIQDISDVTDAGWTYSFPMNVKIGYIF